MRMNRWACCVLAGIWVLPSVAVAQDTAGVGAIRGTVAGAGRAQAVNVALCVRGLDRCTTSDATGHFLLSDLRAGRYELEIAGPSPAPLIAAVDVRAGRETLVDVILPATDAVQETVTVAAPTFVAA